MTMTEMTDLSRGKGIKINFADRNNVWVEVLLSNEDSAIVREIYGHPQLYFIRNAPNDEIEIFEERKENSKYMGKGTIQL